MILLCYGTRPEYIKIKPIIDEMDRRGTPYKILFTGQHEDIGKFKHDFKLEIKDGSNRLDSVVASLMNIPDEVFEGITHMLVQGDTTSAFALAVSAMHRKIDLVHLEAGLRSGDLENPYPEEYNRQLIARIASVNLCPTVYNSGQLGNEEASGSRYIVGNTVLDNLLDYKDKCEYTNKVLVTMHRRENHHWMAEWFKEIDELAANNPDLEFILPIHPNPNVQKHKGILKHVKVIEPLSHSDLIELLVKCRLVITDSGGLQEECSFFNKKCLVCRKRTERFESVDLTSFMVMEPSDLGGLFNKHIQEYEVDVECPFGDGTSAIKICDILDRRYGK